MVLAVIAVLASVLTLWYYLILQRKAFFGKLNERWTQVKEAPFWMTAATVVLALIVIGVGVWLRDDHHDLDPAGRGRPGEGILSHDLPNHPSGGHHRWPRPSPSWPRIFSSRPSPWPSSSLLLGIIFFRMGAPYAGVFEISVVAGLITVLFMLTIALTKTGRRRPRIQDATWIFPLFFILFALIDILVMKGLLAKIPALGRRPRAGTFGEVLWKQRTFDLVGQLAVILAGVFAVLALFRKKDKDD